MAPPATAASGTLTLDPTSGTGADPVSVVTSGGCATDAATHFVVKLTGAGVQYVVAGSGSTGPTYESVNYMVGNTALSTIGSTGSATTAMRVPLSKLFGTVKAENKDAKLPSGTYTLSFECRGKSDPKALSTFSTAVTITDTASGLTFKEGAAAPITNVTKPKVTGTAKVGKTLKVSKGTWSTTPTSYAYSWKIGSKVVSTKSTYKVSKSAKGKKVTVTVTAKADGYTDGKAKVTVTIKKK